MVNLLHCKRGHLWRIRPILILRDNGTIAARCRACHNLRTNAYIKLRYRNDPDFRKKTCARARAYALRRKELSNASV